MSTAKEMFKQFLNENPTQRTFTFIAEPYDRYSRGDTFRKKITAPTLFAALVKACNSSRRIANCIDEEELPVDITAIDNDDIDFTTENFEDYLNASDEEVASIVNANNGEDYIIIMEKDKWWVGDEDGDDDEEWDAAEEY